MEKFTARFGSPSCSLRMKALLKRTRKTVGLALAVALGIHLVLSKIVVFETERKAARPLTTRFIKREPRLTKPLELKKPARPKPRALQRRMVSAEAKMHWAGRGAGLQAGQVLRGLARPNILVGRIARFAGVAVEPQAVASIIEGAREVEQKIDMSLELLDIQALDTGQYHALVVEDPYDKRAIRGFIHITMASPSQAILDHKNWQFRRGIQNLSEFINKHTAIRSDVSKPIPFDSMGLFNTPWVYLFRRRGFDVTESELLNLGRYMLSGGFLWADCMGKTANYVAGRNDVQYAVIKSLENQGFVHNRDWTYERLPSSHALLHCYYDLDTPPMAWGATDRWFRQVTWDTTPYVEAIVRDGVVICLNTQQGCVHAWGDWGPDGVHDSFKELDPTRCLEFGVNTIIFALTLEGSITHRLMDSIQ